MKRIIFLLFLNTVSAKQLRDNADARHRREFLDWGDNGITIQDPNIPTFEDLGWGNFDWDTFDWNNFDPDGLNWNDFGGWGDGTWDDMFSNLKNVPEMNMCSLLESAIGMGRSFGIAGDCTCDGTLISGMNISCSFEKECVEDSDVCGSVSLNNTFGDMAGSVSTSSCLDFENDDYAEICFSYDFDVTGGDSQACTASYDGNLCDCEMDNFCIKIDCSKYLPGTTMDTCKQLQMETESDIVAFLPRFKIFDKKNSELEFGEINFGSVDWENFDWENFDFATVEWGDASWAEMLSGQNFDSMDICPILESAISMGSGFAIAADCSCEGGISSTMNIACDFEQCIPGTETCGSISLGFYFDNFVSVSAGACLDFESEKYLKTCFTYEIPISDFSSQTCTASYGDNDCACEIDNLCISIDCSNYLPGAKMDSCQQIQIEDGEGIEAFALKLSIFDPAFEGFNFENVDWQNLDWENLDWENFSLNSIDWGNSNWENIEWNDIISINVKEAAVCPVLERVIKMSEDLSAAGSCACDGSVYGGFDMFCNFEEVCLDSGLCGSVALSFAFDSVGAVSGNACTDFTKDDYLETCFSYKIPIADRQSPPECSAKYGGEACTCKIDEDFCLKIDCSEHEASAVIDSCQAISMEGAGAESFFPRFAVSNTPGVDDSVVKGDGDKEIDGGVTDDLQLNSPSEANESENSSAGHQAQLSALEAIVLFATPLIFLTIP